MKCALVTGGSRGIGKAICLRLAEQGYYVLINYLSNEEEASNTLAEVRKAGSDGELLPFDVADKEQVRLRLGGWIEDDQWSSVISTSLDAFFYVTKLVLNGMLLNKYGRIVNVVSLSGLKGVAGQTNYSAAKGGVIAATKALAQEVGRHGITVNAVAPGFIHTEMTGDIDEKQMRVLIPVRRFGSPEEVAHAVSFLTSPQASYITGEILSVNGGLYS